MKPLHAIAAEIDAITALLAGGDDEIPEDIEARLDACNLDLETKLENCVGALRNFAADAERNKAEAAIYSNEAKLFADRARVAENAEARLKKYVKNVLDHLNITKIEAGKFKIRIQANSVPTTTLNGAEPAKAPQSELAMLPDDFRRTTYALDTASCVEEWKQWMATKPDASDIKAMDAWEQGPQLPAGVRVEKGSHLRVT